MSEMLIRFGKNWRKNQIGITKILQNLRNKFLLILYKTFRQSLNKNQSEKQ